MTIDALLQKYHWTDNPQVYDDLLSLEEDMPYHCVAVLDNKPQSIMDTRLEIADCDKDNAQKFISAMKQQKYCIAIIVTKGDRALHFERNAKGWIKSDVL